MKWSHCHFMVYLIILLKNYLIKVEFEMKKTSAYDQVMGEATQKAYFLVDKQYVH